MINNLPVFTSYSQAGQDVFAYFVCGKDNGTFLDIGASNADYGNNSYGLEKRGWTGITVDYGSEYADKHIEVRKMPLNVMDMTLIDWDAFIANNEILQSTVDYLSFDIDEASLPVLRKFPFNKLQFRALTIEHDAYRFGDGTRQEMRQILQNAGYDLLVANVMIHFESPETRSLNGFVPFEDWYVRTDLVDMEVANQFRANNKLWSDVLASELHHTLNFWTRKHVVQRTSIGSIPKTVLISELQEALNVLDRVIPPNINRDLPEVVWFFSRTDDLASLISAPAVIRNRFPAECYRVTVVLPTGQLVPRVQMDIMHFLLGFTVYELADLNIVGLCNSYLNTRAEIDMSDRYFVFF